MPTISGGLIRCGRCGRRYTFRHTCVVRLGSTRRRRRTKVSPTLSIRFTCGTCGRRYTNPLTHVCNQRTGYSRRVKAAKRAPAPRPASRPRPAPRPRETHEYAACPDGPECMRFPCRVYREGWQAGYDRGFLDGESAGYTAGFAAGAAAAAGTPS